MDDSLDEIYREHASGVYRYLLSLTRDPDLAEELTQETFYRAVKSIGSYDGTCKVYVWLCQIAKHIWYQTLDRRRRRGAAPLGDETPSGASLEDSAVLAGEKAALYRAIHALDEPQREVVHMRLTGEFSFREIGEILGKTENWARVTFYRAKQKLTEDMK
jgi:RNA polymerase sigma-70 factor (ECF subfamily)